MEPFLLRGMVSIRNGKETFSHSSPYCSLNSNPVFSARQNSPIGYGVHRGDTDVRADGDVCRCISHAVDHGQIATVCDIHLVGYGIHHGEKCWAANSLSELFSRA